MPDPDAEQAATKTENATGAEPQRDIGTSNAYVPKRADANKPANASGATVPKGADPRKPANGTAGQTAFPKARTADGDVAQPAAQRGPDPEPADPPSRHATWGQISDAAADSNVQQDLDIAWIESLPVHIRDSIDVAFADNTAEAQVAKTAAPGLAKIDAETNAHEKRLAKDTKQHLIEEHKRATDRDVASDPTYLAERNEFEHERAQEKEEYLRQSRKMHDASVKIVEPSQSVARPESPTVKRPEGKALARTNFMSWAVDIFGGAEAVKAHFLGIKPVKGHPNMWLATAARARFEAAEADFEARHPGYTLVDTSVANDLRGMHQQRWGIGMLGHAIGDSFDLKAIDNPNIKIDDFGHNHAYMISKFGGEQDKRGTGRAKMSIPEPAIEKLGQDTVSGKSTPEGAALIERVRQQFAEMSTTSEHLKRSMAAAMPELQEARDRYFDQAGLRVELAKAKADLAHADAVANKQLAGQKFNDADAKKGAIAEIKLTLVQAAGDKAAALLESEKAVARTLNTAFAAWTTSIQADIDADQGLLDQDQSSRGEMTSDEQALAAIDANNDDAKTQLNQFATAHNLTTLEKMRSAPKDAKTYKQALVRELKARDVKATRGLSSRDADAHADIKELQFYRKKLIDPEFVFGRGEKHSDGHWGSKYDVSQVPLMQLLEHGTVRDDPMPDREASGARQGVYNGEVVATLAKYGWAPGANYGDTMHFDFIEGFNKAVPGGRGSENMKRTRYSPEGDLPTTASASGRKDEAKK